MDTDTYLPARIAIANKRKVLPPFPSHLSFLPMYHLTELSSLHFTSRAGRVGKVAALFGQKRKYKKVSFILIFVRLESVLMDGR